MSLTKIEKQNQKAENRLLRKNVYSAIDPLLRCGIDLVECKKILDEMYVALVSNAPDNEIDNFTARQASPFFLALSESITNLNSIPTIRMLTSPDFC